MGGVADLVGKAVYLDTNVLVYAVEGFDEHEAFIDELFRSIDARQLDAVTSELTLAEVLVKPLEIGRQDVADLYTELVRNSDRLSVLPIDRPVLLSAAHYRAELGVKLPDAIHIATAVVAGCDVFLSNDQRIKMPPDLTLQRLA